MLTVQNGLEGGYLFRSPLTRTSYGRLLLLFLFGTVAVLFFLLSFTHRVLVLQLLFLVRVHLIIFVLDFLVHARVNDLTSLLQEIVR